MAKIPSNASPINFGSNDTLAGIKQLGSTVKEGTPVTSTNITTLLENVIDGLYANNVDAGGNAKLPIAGELNGLFYSVFGLLAHIQQNGIQEYNADIEYPAFALAKSVDGEALYQSKVNLNKGNALTDTTKWLSLCNISDLQYLLQATNTTRGTSRFATDAEVLAGTATNIGITPAGLNSLYLTGEYKLIARTNDYGNWLICDGRAISRTQYSNLFTAIGSAFGSGDGSTTFNIPDLRGKVAGGIGQGSGLTNRTLGNNVGAETHTLDINQMPSHRHSMSIVNIGSTLGILPQTTIGSVTFTTTYTDYTGGGQSHNNMQPTLFAGNYFIYAG